tara:strand:+ start:177 stop:626 length:450 start_codon:yes stop_codon:yes gene_type:complete
MVSLEVAMFWISSIMIVPIWIMMWFVPKHDVTQKVLSNPWYCIVPLTVPYTILVIPEIVDVFLIFGSQMPTPELVVEFFDDETAIMLAWLHMLALDTLGGRWIWKRMVEHDRPIWMSMPTLLLCMMVAPLGILIGVILTRDQDFEMNSE